LIWEHAGYPVASSLVDAPGRRRALC